jgi:trehalose 6-phosphate phosphatase
LTARLSFRILIKGNAFFESFGFPEIIARNPHPFHKGSMKQLFKEWEAVEGKILRGGTLFLFLDYDGVLAPIADQPETAVCPRSIKALLETLRGYPNVFPAIISGRSLDNIRAMVGVEGMIYVGNHGLEIQNPAGIHKKILSDSRRREFQSILQEVREKMEGIPGILLEDKGPIVSIHYRKTPPEHVGTLQQTLDQILQPWHHRWQITRGKKVFEIRPKANFSKGKAVQEILNGFPAGDVLPVYFGDDDTDEDAFAVLRNRGVTIFVGPDWMSSGAEYYLDQSAEVEEALRRIVSILRRQGGGLRPSGARE